MGRVTGIDWCDATVNFWVGCQKVSPGCKYCYMFRDMAKYGMDPADIHRTQKTVFQAPIKWTEPKIIFVNSWSDFFIKEGDQWRDEAWDVMRQSPQHTYILLTKRIERVRKCLPADWGNGWPNVWIGFSAENQDLFDKRVPYLSKFNAVVKFASLEPLLGQIDMHLESANKGAMDWVIVGGESGNDVGKYRYRPCKMDWISSIVQQCFTGGVSLFVKQLGTHLATAMELQSRTGKLPGEWPEGINTREHPTPKINRELVT